MSRVYQDPIRIEKEDFAMQRGYLFALTMRDDVPTVVKKYIEQVERRMSDLAGVKSSFEVALEMDIEIEQKKKGCTHNKWPCSECGVFT